MMIFRKLRVINMEMSDTNEEYAIMITAAKSTKKKNLHT